MTTSELFAHYKKIAPAEDLKFFLAAMLSPELRARAEAITKPKARDLVALRTSWREERLMAERLSGEPAIGTAAWHEAHELVQRAA